MKKELFEETRIPLQLQFFAEGGSDGDDSGTGDEGNDDDAGNGDGDHTEDQNGDANKGQKTFTQAEVTQMMTKEKKEGRKAVLNSLGFKSEKEAKETVELLKQITGAAKTDEEKKAEAAKEANEANARATAAENKLTLLTGGVNKESLDDALAIASLKVTEEKDLAKVIEEMKNEAKYAGFFVEAGDAGSKGTGKVPPNSKSKGDQQSYGKRLAESGVAKTQQTKSSYF